MDFTTYQDLAYQTRIYPDKYRILYPLIKLSGEVGEVSELIGKCLRKDQDPLSIKERVLDELGDVLWYVANLATDYGLSLEDIAKYNIEKLQKRYSS